MPVTDSATRRRRRGGYLAIILMAVLATALLVACDSQTTIEPPTPPATPTTSDSAASIQPLTRSTAVTSASPAFVQVTVGEDHSCALQEDGRAVCWGKANERQLKVPDGLRFRQIAAGAKFTCGIRLDGGISCWGENDHQQLDAPDGQFTLLDAGWDHACALQRNSAICWGWNANERATPPEGALFSTVAAGAEHSCGLTIGRDLVCWGKNDNARGDSQDGPFRALAVGLTHTCVLRDDGTAFCQGSDQAGQSDPPSTAFTAISAGADHTCGLLANHSIECWGAHAQDRAANVRLAAPPGTFAAIDAGWTRTCAVAADGYSQCWDYSYRFRPLSPFDRLNFQNVTVGYILDSPTEALAWPTGGFAVANKDGLITLYDGKSEPKTLLDLRESTYSDSLESGMLSVATDPEFGKYPFIYVYYSLRFSEGGGSDQALVRLSRFPVSNGQIDKDLELVILEVPRQKEKTLHYGGAIRFGLDGMLYLGLGDSACIECPQSLNELHGKIIRIDVRGASIQSPYRVPDDNPFVGVPDARPEIWAYGLRNPWRMAFDMHDGQLWVGDVGHQAEEEVSIAAAGANLGWPAFEGANCFTVLRGLSDREKEIASSYRCSEVSDTVAPVATYRHHGNQCAVVGGIVYRGTAIPWLRGTYLFGDYCSGHVWALDGDANSGWQMIQIADLPNNFSSFGTDTDGEIYLSLVDGPILRLVESESGYVPPVTIVPSETIAPAAPGRT
jgi:glucose/arabinose dehydrogenase